MQHRSKKHPYRVSLGVLSWMLGLAVLLASFGVFYGVLKNQQLNVKREIERIRLEVRTNEQSIDQYNAKISTNTSRWAIRDRLAQDKSLLVSIQDSQVEREARINTPPAIVVK